MIIVKQGEDKICNYSTRFLPRKNEIMEIENNSYKVLQVVHNISDMYIEIYVETL